MKRNVIRMAALLLMLSLAVPCVFAQSYKTYVESSNPNKQEISKSNAIMIMSLADSYSMNRSTEKALKVSFEKKGISVMLASDTYDITTSDEETIEAFKKRLSEESFRYMMLVEPTDMYTYTYGGGISSLNYYCEVMDLYYNNSTVLMMELSVEADKNDRLSYNASKEPALKSFAEVLVNEYLKYAR